MSTAMRSLLRARSALPNVARGVRKQLVPVFSVPVRTMSIPRPSWDKDLQDLDPEVYKIIQQEQDRQHKGIALIPSENYTTHAVSQVPFVPVSISVVQLLEPLLSRTVSWDARYVVAVSTARAAGARLNHPHRWGDRVQALGSVMTNKYSEGYPGQRYYGGNEFIDMSGISFFPGSSHIALFRSALCKTEYSTCKRIYPYAIVSTRTRAHAKT